MFELTPVALCTITGPSWCTMVFVAGSDPNLYKDPVLDSADAVIMRRAVQL
jgi:hypothetical protein